MKKTIRILLILFIALFVILLATPLLFEKQITELVKSEINKSIEAKVSFSDLNISLLKNFPNATIGISDLSITPHKNFEKDTLIYFQTIELKTGLFDVLQTKPKIKSISLKTGIVNLITDINGNTNYDISKPSTNTENSDTTNEASELALEIENYSLQNIDFHYIDNQGQMKALLNDINHLGSAELKGNLILLNTKTTVNDFSFFMGEMAYLNSVNIDLKAGLGLDLDKMKFTFRENNAKLNDLNLNFDGFLQLNENDMLMDIKFNSISSKFKSLLSLVPSAYSSNFSGVKAKGDLEFKGKINGTYKDEIIPKLAIDIETKNASFQYPDLPKSVENIFIDTHISNTTGKLDDTQVLVNNFALQIDQDKFNANAKLTKLTTNPTVKATLNGIINLGNLSKAYPIKLDQKLEGILKANIATSFNQNAIEKNNYQQIKNKGSLSVKNFSTQTEMLPKPINIRETDLFFNTKNFTLKNFQATTGESDLAINGTIDNLYAYLFGNKELIGNFNVKSDMLKVSDLLSSTDTTAVIKETDTITTSTDDVKIPAKINALINLKAKTIIYDNITLNDVTGQLKVKDQKAEFIKTNAKMFKGNITIDGGVDTKPSPSNFDLKLNIKDFDIASSFSSLELLKSIAPFANIIDGKMSTSFNMNGGLDKDMFPDINSITGDALANLQVDKIDSEKSQAMSLLDSKLSFIDFDKLDVKKIKTFINFEKGKVNFKPFKLASYEGIPITIGGSHSFNNQMDYKLTLDLPAKYLGNSVGNLLSQLSAKDQEQMKVPFTINIGGSVTKPSLQPDLKSATAALKTQIIEAQKNKLLDKFLGSSSKSKDSTSTSPKNDIKKAASKLLKGLFK